MPTATDLVTDLPADFEVFGQAVATSMADLLGGTSGQILAKNSNTDMDFVWIANDQGDITGITATSPLTGGGSSGAVTVGIQDALTTQKGAVQLSDSTSTTSSILAATPTAVKAAYDLADGAIAKTTVTTAGDIVYRNATVPTRLGIGTAGQVLTVNTGATAPEWTTPAGGGGKILQVVSATTTTQKLITTTTPTDTNITASITPSATSSKVLVMITYNLRQERSSTTAVLGAARIVRGATAISTWSLDSFTGFEASGSTGTRQIYDTSTVVYVDSPSTTSSTTYKFQGYTNYEQIWQINSNPSHITLMEIGV